MSSLERWAEAKSLVRKVMPHARRILGRVHENTLKLEGTLLEAIHWDDSSSLDELRKAISMCEDAIRRARRVYGDEHPLTMRLARDLDEAREELARRTQR